MKTLYSVLLLATSIFGLPKTFSFVDNMDGTISDEVTGLMWQKDMGDEVTWANAMNDVGKCRTGDYDDWRMPNVKELFSLIRYSGQCKGDDSVTMFIDIQYFVQPIGDTSIPSGREIDAQTWSDLKFNGTIMNNELPTSFGVNFVDGRVKNYPADQGKYARYVRGNLEYSINEFSDNGDGTVSDSATGLMWAQNDSGEGLNWGDALAYCEHLNLAGYSDWRLPTIKELNSIVDYSKCQNCAAINQTVFNITMVPDPDGNTWYPYFWSSTTLLDGNIPGDEALYQTFGRALAYVNGTLADAHGPGAIRGDPKNGSRSDFPSHEQGYQGDIQYVYNYVRPVRDIATSNPDGSLTYPIVETNVTICFNDYVEIPCPTKDFQPFYGQNGNLESVSYAFEISSNSNGGSSLAGLIVGLCLGALFLSAIAAGVWYDRRKKAIVANGNFQATLIDC